MNTRRLNITLPAIQVERLRKVANKSAFIAQAIQDKLDAQDRVSRDALLAEAYRSQAAADRAVIDDWEPLAGEGL